LKKVISVKVYCNNKRPDSIVNRL